MLFGIFYSPNSPNSQRIAAKYLNLLLTSDSPAETRGFGLALGVLPPKLIGYSPWVLDSVLAALGAVAGRTTGGEKDDAETRRNCVESVNEIVSWGGWGGRVDGSIYAKYRQGGASSAQSFFTFGRGQIKKVLSIYEEALNDYSIDKRGDIGSWIRTSAVVGLRGLCFLAARLHGEGYSYPIYGALAAGTEDENEDEDEEKNIVLLPNAEERKKLGFLNIEEARARPPPSSQNEAFWTEEDTTLVMKLILKQLSEKLDSVRGVTGGVFSDIVTGTCVDIFNKEDYEEVEANDMPNDDDEIDEATGEIIKKTKKSGGDAINAINAITKIKIPYMKDRDAIESALSSLTRGSSGGKCNCNWSNPHLTMPLPVLLLTLPHLRGSILSGLVLSVGGLTEAVVKSSSSALLNLCRSAKKAIGTTAAAGKGKGKGGARATKVGGNNELLAGIGKSLLDMVTLHTHHADDRVVVPLVKTWTVLVSNDVFESFGMERGGGTSCSAWGRS